MKSETYASIKYILAVMGLAVMAAGQVLVDHSAKIDAMDDELPETNDYELTGTGAVTQLPQITVADISNATLDSTGLPWDARIHSGNKTLNQDKTWKKRKGVPENIVDAVTAELRATAAPTPAAPVADTAPVIPAPPVTVAIPTPAVQIPLPNAAPVVTDYTKLCDFLAKNTGEGYSLNDTWVGAFFAANDTTLPALASDPDKAGKLLTALRDTLKQYSIPEVV
jgi:hypothetical protein